MIKYKFYFLIVALMVSLTMSAQHDAKAKQILDQVAKTYDQSSGMKIEFKGTQRGTLWMKGQKFVLECAGVKSWFNGETQWSYVEENQEVNVSTPSREEIESINPYALVTMYRQGFDYRFQGQKNRNGKLGNEIVLIPNNNQDIRMFILAIGDDSIPFYVGIDMTNGHYEEFIVTKLENIAMNDEFFHFDEKAYPNVEVIDLR